MEKSNGQKRKFKRTNLTISKKSKWYHLSHSVSNKSIVNTAESDTESSCASESDTSTDFEKTMKLHSTVSTSDKSLTCKPDTSDKSTQNKLSQRNFAVQFSMPLAVKGTQTLKPAWTCFKINLHSVLPLHELPSDIFINELRKDDILEKFIQNLEITNRLTSSLKQ